jgi:O-antigen biosynthesis protein
MSWDLKTGATWAGRLSLQRDLKSAARALMGSHRTIFDEPHHQSLELLAVEALTRGDTATAFRLADRRCRISPQPSAHSYVLRGDALFRLGETSAAVLDIAKALTIAPADIGASRRMLAWGNSTQQKQAAVALVTHDRDFAVLRRAIEVLRREGERAFASTRVFDDVIEGWAVWEGEVPLEATITDGSYSVTVRLEADPNHPMRDIGRALCFKLPRPMSLKPQSILLSVAHRTFYSKRAPGRDDGRATHLLRSCRDVGHVRRVTVVVPVYGDFEATRDCLESLLGELRSGSDHRAIVINDATPDPRIAEYLARVASEPRIHLVTNDRNLGFVGAVNRALGEVVHGDVVLLNADTIVPRGFIDRLAAVARSSPDIGTVTPLSNNGDLAGFPSRHSVEPLGSVDDVERVDKIAARVNAGRVVDIPNGVGFCLYITRDCLDAVGGLCEDYTRGYLEDVDFCLRAHDCGFRNVCAPSVYVGHAGSKSFGAEKPTLVARNFDVLRYRYPEYPFQFGAFDLANPLRACREAIERHLCPGDRSRLLITGAGVVAVTARARGCWLASRGQGALILEVHHRAAGPQVTIADPTGGVPQSIQFDLASNGRCDSLLAYLREVRPSRMEIFDPINIPLRLIDLLAELRLTYDMVIADAGLLGRDGARALLASTRSIYRSDDRKRRVRRSRIPLRSEDSVWVHRWCEIADGAEKIVAADEQGRAFAAEMFPGRTIYKMEDAGRNRGQIAVPPATMGAGGHLGLLPIRSCAQEQWLMREIAGVLRHERPRLALTVLGRTIDDLNLMRIGNIHVTGKVSEVELAQIACSYGLDGLFVNVTQPLFGHTLLSAAYNLPVPIAYFDWSMGRVEVAKGDLGLDPRLSVDAVVAELGRWMEDR